jgi:hypothetical protein
MNTDPKNTKPNGGFNFDSFPSPEIVDFDESLILTQTVDTSGSSGVRLYKLEDSLFAFTSFSRDPHSATGWSELLLAKGMLTLIPPSFDLDALSQSIDDAELSLENEKLSELILNYKTQCISVLESAILDVNSKHGAVFRGFTVYVEDLSWPSSFISSMGSQQSEQLISLLPILLRSRVGLDEDSWIQMRGHYMVHLQFEKESS